MKLPLQRVPVDANTPSLKYVTLSKGVEGTLSVLRVDIREPFKTPQNGINLTCFETHWLKQQLSKALSGLDYQEELKGFGRCLFLTPGETTYTIIHEKPNGKATRLLLEKECVQHLVGILPAVEEAVTLSRGRIKNDDIAEAVYALACADETEHQLNTRPDGVFEEAYDAAVNSMATKHRTDEYLDKLYDIIGSSEVEFFPYLTYGSSQPDLYDMVLDQHSEGELPRALVCVKTVLETMKKYKC
ncbi:hypothetical protein HDE_02636 [Halotydeus destructor]|nr:hypothetical protein HDE_02636 [Halotydeus destructor]